MAAKKTFAKFTKKVGGIVFILILSNNLFSQTVPYGFEITKVLVLQDNDLGFDILPDGRIIVINKSREIKLFVNGELRNRHLIVLNAFTNTESGLTGIAIDPDYPSEPYLYLFYSHKDSTNRISRFTFIGDLTNPNSDSLYVNNELVLLALPLNNDVHNGGTLRFGKDKTLYISYGDDEQSELVQSLSTYNGKILRINRDGTVPFNNPTFQNEPADKKPEIFAIGLRNPFRFSLDSNDGLFIGDVGRALREELNISIGGENFGWPKYEGTLEINPSTTLIEPVPLFPVFEYKHTGGLWAVIALLSYNKSDASGFPVEFDGVYFYADFFHGWIRYLRMEFGKWVSREFGTGFVMPVDAMLMQDGSIYILEFGTALSKIVYIRPDPIEGDIGMGKKLRLNKNFPNPFNPVTIISYELYGNANINIEVYDILGSHVRTLINNQYQQSGSYSIKWDGLNKLDQTVASGVYIYTINAGNFTQSRKMLFIK